MKVLALSSLGLAQHSQATSFKVLSSLEDMNSSSNNASTTSATRPLPTIKPPFTSRPLPPPNFFADIALCPLEATRIRLVSEPTFATGLVSGFGKIYRQEGIGAFYSGFGPILFKQVPYTMAKFVVYEKMVELMYGNFVNKNTASDGTKTFVNLGSGLMAGFAAALVSQPADTMLSKINKTKGLPGEGTTSRLIKIAKELGLKGSYAGIGARLFMVGTLTAGQFAIYGDIKRITGAVGGVDIASTK